MLKRSSGDAWHICIFCHTSSSTVLGGETTQKALKHFNQNLSLSSKSKVAQESTRLIELLQIGFGGTVSEEGY